MPGATGSRPWSVLDVGDEPKRRGAVVVDKDGDHWQRGNTRWTCTAPVDGARVTRVGRLPWSALVSVYGPISFVSLPARAGD